MDTALGKMPVEPALEYGALAPTGLPEEVEFCSRCVISNQRPITSVESSTIFQIKSKQLVLLMVFVMPVVGPI